MLIYDCEIWKAILGRGEAPVKGIEYCKGWEDYKGMGISCIGAYDYEADRYRIFCMDNFAEFQKLVDSHDIIAGFNSLHFDNQLCLANDLIVPVEKSYDVLVEIWKAAGLGPEFQYPGHTGFGLGNIVQANFGIGKSGYGGVAPVQWQRLEIGAVIDYCLDDVRLTRMVLDKIIKDGQIADPRDPACQLVGIRKPS